MAALAATAISGALLLQPRQLRALESRALATETDRATPEAAIENKLIVLPMLLYSPEMGLAAIGSAIYRFRIGSEQESYEASNVRLSIGYTTRGQVGAELVPTLFLDRERWKIMGDLTARRVDDNFYGIGNDTDKADEDLIERRFVGVRADARRRLYSDLFAGVVYEFLLSGISDEGGQGIFRELMPHGYQGARTSGAGLVIAWDDRDSIYETASGSLAELFALGYAPFLGSDDTSYFRLTYDLRHFLALSTRVALGLRFVGDHIVAGRAPFDRLPELGGTAKLRGIYRGRFRDNHQLSLQTELRYPIYWRFRGVVFGGIGRVARSIGDFALKGIHPTGGAGLRVAFDRKARINARLDVGFSEDDWGVYLDLAEAF